MPLIYSLVFGERIEDGSHFHQGSFSYSVELDTTTLNKPIEDFHSGLEKGGFELISRSKQCHSYRFHFQAEACLRLWCFLYKIPFTAGRCGLTVVLFTMTCLNKEKCIDLIAHWPMVNDESPLSLLVGIKSYGKARSTREMVTTRVSCDAKKSER